MPPLALIELSLSTRALRLPMIHAAAGQLSRPFRRGSVESAWRDLEHPPKFASSRPMPRDRHGGFTTDNVPHVTVSPLVDFTWEWLGIVVDVETGMRPRPRRSRQTHASYALGAWDIRQKRTPPEGRCERPLAFLGPCTCVFGRHAAQRRK